MRVINRGLLEKTRESKKRGEGESKFRPVFERGDFHSTVSVLKNAVLAQDI